MKDERTADIFDIPYYGYSQPVIEYNKNIGRFHNENDVYFLEGNRCFHHITQPGANNKTGKNPAEKTQDIKKQVSD